MLDEIFSFCKRKGFVYPSSEIYGGCEGFWDYGPLGSLLYLNIKNAWIDEFIKKRENIVLIESSIIMSRKVWQASGHEKEFVDLLVECKKCHRRFREDFIKDKCPFCGGKDFTPPKKFNLMFKTYIGPVEKEGNLVYLRPETAQGMFVNFKNVLSTYRLKLPFGIAQVGKCFRNEITPRHFLFRTREFEIAEIEFFVKPEEDEKWFEYWLEEWEKFFLALGIKKENLKRYEHKKEELAHYSKRTVDILYKFPFGWGEIAGIAQRSDYDLKKHSEASKKDFKIKEGKKEYFPYCIEPTLGLGRVFLAIICDAYEKIPQGRDKTGREEVVLHLHPKLSPIKVAVFPLIKKEKRLCHVARKIYENLKEKFFSFYDEEGSIGRRYRRQDEIGTPLAITVDFQTLEDETVTLRDRESMRQIRVKISQLEKVIKKALQGENFLSLGKVFIANKNV